WRADTDVAAAAAPGGIVGFAGVWELLVRDGTAASARLLRAGPNRVGIRGVLLGVRRLTADAEAGRRGARGQHRVSCGAGGGAGARQVALQTPRARCGSGPSQAAGNVRASPRVCDRRRAAGARRSVQAVRSAT